MLPGVVKSKHRGIAHRTPRASAAPHLGGGVVAPDGHVGHAGVKFARLDGQLALRRGRSGEAAATVCKSAVKVPQRQPHCAAAAAAAAAALAAACHFPPPTTVMRKGSKAHLGAVLVQACQRVPVAGGQVGCVVDACERGGAGWIAGGERQAVGSPKGQRCCCA